MMYSTRAFHMFSRFPTRAVAMLLLPAVLVFMALGCGGGEPASPSGDTTPQATAESQPRERGPGSGSAGASTPQSTSQAASQQQGTGSGASTPVAGTLEPTRVGQSGATSGQAGQPAPTAAAGGQSGTTPGQTEVPAPTATPAPTPTPAPPPCPQPQPASDVMRPPAQTSPETDREALIALFNATGGESWDSSGTWLGRTPIGQWSGVTTNGQGRVIRLELVDLIGELPPELGNLSSLQWLNLGGNQLSGEIPPELGNLSSLQWLYLSDNRFSGGVPPELGNLKDLYSLYLDRNQLSGEIPPELGNLTSLQSLSISSNQLCGEIPSQLGDLANLQGLDLGGNQLSGEIPLELSSLRNLQWLRLNENELSGEIPPWLEDLVLNLSWIEESERSQGSPLWEWSRRSGLSDKDEYRWLWRARHVDLGQNRFSGCVSDYAADFHTGWNSGLPVCTPPDHPGDTETLTAIAETWGLYAGVPGFENWLGRAPIAEWEGVSVDASGRVVALTVWGQNAVPELGNFDKLRVLILANLFGVGDIRIPPELGNLARLQLLIVDGITGGEIPPELGSLSNLRLLFLMSGSHRTIGLSGEIPPELGALANLQVLHLSRSLLSGEIPPELGNLTNLRVLNLEGHQLSGEIPPELGNLTNLQTLELGGNQLSGCLPASLRDQGVYISWLDPCP